MSTLEFHCVVCKAQLVEAERTEVCDLCGQTEETAFVCPSGHFFCVACRVACPAEVVSRVCLAATTTDPFQIAAGLMLHPHFLNHGPQFHYVVAPVLVAAAHNAGYSGTRSDSLAGARKRMECIPAAACGSFGGCGAALSVGAAVSLLTHANHLKGAERSLVLASTGKALAELAAFGGPRCCRQAVYAALEVGTAILRTHLGIGLTNPNVVRCSAGETMDGCQGPGCRFHG